MIYWSAERGLQTVGASAETAAMSYAVYTALSPGVCHYSVIGN